MSREYPRAWVTLRRRGDGVWHAHYQAYDRVGRLMFQDDGTASVHWEGFMRRAERDVGALRLLDAHGYMPVKDWPRLVEEAEI